MLRNIAVVVVNGFLPFEFGTICEVFGVDRADDGLPSYDLAVVAGEPVLLRAHNDFTIQPSCGLERLEEADTIALPAVDDDRLQPRWRPEDPGKPRSRRPRPAVHPGGRASLTTCRLALRRAVERGARALSVRSGAFILGEALVGRHGRLPLHHPLAERARTSPPLSFGQGRSGCPLRRRRPGGHERGHRRRHRRMPLPGQEGTRLAGRQRHRPPHGGPAAP